MVEFKLEKCEIVWWDRLLENKARQHWLRVDFQNWRDEEDLGDETEPFEEVSDDEECLDLLFNMRELPDELEHHDGGLPKT